MTTPEQQALLDDLISHLDDAATHVKALIADNLALKAELAAIKQGAGEPYCYVYEWLVSPGVWHRSLSPDKYNGRDCDSFIGLYTRPATPLTDEQLRECFLATNKAEPLAEGWPGLERFARAIEAHIKGAKP